MANYGLSITDNGDGTFSIGTLMRAPTTTTITGGTSLLSTTYTASATTGLLSTLSGTKNSATDTGDGLGHKLRSPMEAIERCVAMIRNDRSFNG